MAAAFDYSGLAGVATELIAKFGRDVTLYVASKTPADAAKPWGPVLSDAAAADDQRVTAKAVLLGPEEGTREAAAVRSNEGRFLVAASSLAALQLDETWRVLDADGRVYEVITAKPIKPGPTLLYYDVRVRT